MTLEVADYVGVDSRANTASPTIAMPIVFDAARAESRREAQTSTAVIASAAN
jgi:hypothetical protein